MVAKLRGRRQGGAAASGPLPLLRRLIWAPAPGSSRERQRIAYLPPGRDSLLSSRRMATTHDNVVPLRRPCRHRSGTSLAALEMEAEARAVTESVRRYEARKAARRAAWGMPPLLAYAIIAAVAVLLATMGWIVNDVRQVYVDHPVPETPATTVTGTTVELDR